MDGAGECGVAGCAVSVAKDKINRFAAIADEADGFAAGDGGIGGHGVAIDVPDLAVIIVSLIQQGEEFFVIGNVVSVDAVFDFFLREGTVIDRDARFDEAADEADAGAGTDGGFDFTVFPWGGEKFGVDVGLTAIKVDIAAREVGLEEDGVMIGGACEKFVDEVIGAVF